MAKPRRKRLLPAVITTLGLLAIIAGLNEYLYHQDTLELYPPGMPQSQPYDAIIVLGADVASDGSISQIGKARMDEALDLYRAGKAARIIVSGGVTNPAVATSEAKTMYEYALLNGVPESAVVLEERAMGTAGNAYYVKTRALEPNGWHKNIVVTNGFHIARAKLVFSRVLGEDYVTAYVPSAEKLSPWLETKNYVKERALYLLHRALFLGIKDGDHEKVRSRFELLHLRFGFLLESPRLAKVTTRITAPIASCVV